MDQSAGPAPRRVVITGLGVLSSVGTGHREFWKHLLAGCSGVVSLEDRDWMRPDFRSRIGAPVRDFDPATYGISAREASLLDPASLYALAAAGLAVQDAGFELETKKRRGPVHYLGGVDMDRFACIVGTGAGGLPTTVSAHGYWYTERRKKGCKRYWLPMLIPNAPAGQVAIQYQARAECKAVTTACAAGTMALGDAWRLLRDGEADVALAGGAEATLSDEDGFGMIGFDLLQTMSARNDDPAGASRPFDAGRDGFVLGEGAAILVLETLEHARRRGGPVYAELVGYAANCEAYHMVQPDPAIRQIRRLLEGILARTGTRPEDVDYINAHGTSTRLNDANETQAIRSVFGEAAERLKVSSTKSMTGHAIGASGALEAVATVLSIHEDRIHPTINQETPDPDCDLDYVPNQPVDQEVRCAISTSYGFGGHNAALLLRKPPEDLVRS